MRQKTIIGSKEELELRKSLARNERERDRSQKWFFINLLVAIIFISLTLWLFPLLTQFIIKKTKWTEEVLVNAARAKYLEKGIFFLWVANASLWLFWAVFRFRKWTKYRHQVHVLKEELDNLERESK